MPLKTLMGTMKIYTKTINNLPARAGITYIHKQRASYLKITKNVQSECLEFSFKKQNKQILINLHTCCL